MKINRLLLKNYRCYEEKAFNFHPEFNLIVGQNATGKTAILDAVSVLMVTWLLGFKHRKDKKTLESSDATVKYLERAGEPQFVESWPVIVSAMGSIDGKKIQWERSKESLTGNTRYSKATDLISIFKSSDKNLSETINLPLISYYGTMRLWQDPKASKTNPLKLSQNKPSRTDGYKHCVDPRIGLKELVSWFSRQEWQSFQMGKA